MAEKGATLTLLVSVDCPQNIESLRKHKGKRKELTVSTVAFIGCRERDCTADDSHSAGWKFLFSLFLINRNLCELETSLCLCYVLLNVPVICLVISPFGISKSYPLFIPIFAISVLLGPFLCDLLFLHLHTRIIIAALTLVKKIITTYKPWRGI